MIILRAPMSTCFASDIAGHAISRTRLSVSWPRSRSRDARYARREWSRHIASPDAEIRAHALFSILHLFSTDGEAFIILPLGFHAIVGTGRSSAPRMPIPRPATLPGRAAARRTHAASAMRRPAYRFTRSWPLRISFRYGSFAHQFAAHERHRVRY